MALSTCVPVSTDPNGREQIKHGTALFPVACYHDDLHRFGVEWHWHEELEVFTVETGTARASVPGADYIIKQGEGFFCQHGCPSWGLAGWCRALPPAFHRVPSALYRRQCRQHPLAEISGTASYKFFLSLRPLYRCTEGACPRNRLGMAALCPRGGRIRVRYPGSAFAGRFVPCPKSRFCHKKALSKNAEGRRTNETDASIYSGTLHGRDFSVADRGKRPHW